eukprot:GAFH01004900.1.p3 GENE.GAFH01004900.1~~GAFH01004900.1.p3  ORF type:complete len:78 (-),score=33.13 GAFH01004900.1:37-270(-)
MKFVPRGENECEVTYVGQVDLAGWVPGFIQASIGLKQPLCIANIRHLLETTPAAGNAPVPGATPTGTPAAPAATATA